MADGIEGKVNVLYYDSDSQRAGKNSSAWKPVFDRELGADNYNLIVTTRAKKFPGDKSVPEYLEEQRIDVYVINVQSSNYQTVIDDILTKHLERGQAPRFVLIGQRSTVDLAMEYIKGFFSDADVARIESNNGYARRVEIGSVATDRRDTNGAQEDIVPLLAVIKTAYGTLKTGYKRVEQPVGAPN